MFNKKHITLEKVIIRAVRRASDWK